MQDIYTTNQGKLQVASGDIVFANDTTQNVGIKNVGVLAMRNYLNMNRQFFLENNIDVMAINNLILQAMIAKNINPSSVKATLENQTLSFNIVAE
jgi:hypothetical protein